MTAPNSHKALHVFIPSMALICLVVYLYFPILKDLINDWWIDPNYSHGFLIPFISGYIIWDRRKELTDCTVLPCNWGIVLLLFGVFCLVVGKTGAELFTMRSSLIFVLGGLILLNLGKDHFKIVLLPLAFLFFMVPLPYIVYDSIAFPLKLFAAKVATNSLQLIDVPILREGNIIVLPSTTLEVADACSGMRSLISLIALSVVFAYFALKTTWKRAVLIIAAIPIAIFANSVRIIVTGILAHYFNPELAQGFFHEFSGIILFGAAFFMMLGTYGVINRFRAGD